LRSCTVCICYHLPRPNPRKLFVIFIDTTIGTDAILVLTQVSDNKVIILSLHGLPLNSKTDLKVALHRPVAPLDGNLSLGYACGPLSSYAAVFDPVAARMKGFARPMGDCPSTAGAHQQTPIDGGPNWPPLALPCFWPNPKTNFRSQLLHATGTAFSPTTECWYAC
jgi:hypothetical protein